MGLLLGRPDVDDPYSFIISDAQALPIEGFETRVVADDDNVLNYMIELGRRCYFCFFNACCYTAVFLLIVSFVEVYDHLNF